MANSSKEGAFSITYLVIGGQYERGDVGIAVNLENGSSRVASGRP